MNSFVGFLLIANPGLRAKPLGLKHLAVVREEELTSGVLQSNLKQAMVTLQGMAENLKHDWLRPIFKARAFFDDFIELGPSAE